MPKLTWINHNGEIVGIVPPDVWLEGIVHCNHGLLETYLERDERTKKTIEAVKKLSNIQNDFTAKDVSMKIGIQKKEVYIILSNLENDGIINKTEESRGSKPAKYEYLSDIKRNGYFDFSQKIDIELLNQDSEISDYRIINKSDPEKELKEIWVYSWDEYRKLIEEYKGDVIQELSIPIFSLKLCEFGVYLNETVEGVETVESERITKKRNDSKKIDTTKSNKNGFAGICVCVPTTSSHSTLSTQCDETFNSLKRKFNIFSKNFNEMSFDQQKKIAKEYFDENKKSGYKIDLDFLNNQKKIPQSWINQCLESGLLKGNEKGEYGFGGNK